jgi:hypothetical protein
MIITISLNKDNLETLYAKLKEIGKPFALAESNFSGVEFVFLVIV